MSGLCEICGEQAALDRHHRKRRSQGGDDSPANIMEICRLCHNVIHADPSWAYDQGYLVKSWDDPAQVPVERLVKWPINTKGLPIEYLRGEDPPAGKECPTCHRRVPHKQKKTSPKSKVYSFRVPVDDAETMHGLMEAAAKHMDVYKKPHWQWQVLALAIAHLLQLPEERVRL